MGSNDEFGPDTETIRAWLAKRATYADDARVSGSPRGGAPAADPSPRAAVDRSTAVTRTDDFDHVRRPVGPDSTDAGRQVLGALGVQDPTGPAPEAATVTPAEPAKSAKPKSAEPAASATTVAAAPGPHRPPVRHTAGHVQVGRWTEPEENRTVTEATTDAEFPARNGVRSALSVLLLVVLAATGAASYAAWQAPTTATGGLAVMLGLLTLVVWAARAGCTTTQLAIRRGQLSVRRGGDTELVDVLSPHTPIAILGQPGERRWRVLVERPGRPLIVITPAMVDAHWFTTALYRLRPELRPPAD